jgi:RNA recognition motif-containing protein
MLTVNTNKFIEFYDVRAAEAALRSLNKSEIAGKRIKLEPSRPGGTRRKYDSDLVFKAICLLQLLTNILNIFAGAVILLWFWVPHSYDSDKLAS